MENGRKRIVDCKLARTAVPVLLRVWAVMCVMLALASVGWSQSDVLLLGDIVVVDPNAAAGKSRIVRVNPQNGDQTIISQSNLLDEAAGIVLDPIDGFLLVADRNTGIVKVNPNTGEQFLMVGPGSHASWPAGVKHDFFGITVDSMGKIYTADSGLDPAKSYHTGGGVYQVDRTTGALTLIASGLANGVEIVHPYGIAVDDDDNIILADMSSYNLPPGHSISDHGSGLGAVIRINPTSGNRFVIWGPPVSSPQIPQTTPLACPMGISVEQSGNILITAFTYPDPPAPPVYGCTPPGVYRLNLTTNSQEVLASNHNGTASWKIPFGIDTEANNNIIVGDEGWSAVFRLTPTGSFIWSPVACCDPGWNVNAPWVSALGNLQVPVGLQVIKFLPTNGFPKSSNTAPIVTGVTVNTNPVNENSAASISATFTDPDAADTHTVTINWGDGGITSFNLAAGVLSFNATYPSYFDDNPTGTASDPYTVTVRVADGSLQSAPFLTTITVANVAPTITSVGVSPSGLLGMGATATVTAAFTDPGFQDSHTCSISWGDGATTTGAVAPATGNGNCTGSHAYSTFGNFTVGVTVNDDDLGTITNSSLQIKVNTPPTLTGVSATTPVNEGASTTLTGSFTDPEVGQAHTINVNWGDGTTSSHGISAGVFTFSINHQYLDDNPTGTSSDSYPIAVAVVDSLGDSSGGATSTTVNNVAPVVTGVPSLVSIGTSGSVNATFTANFTDAGRDTHTCTVSWDGGPATTGVVTETNGNGTCAASRTFTTVGLYNVTVTVTDDDNGTATDTEFQVVYDPTAGYVSGAGFINSVAGSYPANPSLTGKATFAFNTRYKLNQTTPSGPTSFNFNVANLKFTGVVYEWLLVDAPTSQFKGTGQINNAGNYGFLVTAHDGHQTGGTGVDRFRIKIWNINGDGSVGSTVYDNVMGAPDDMANSNPQQIGGGSILVFLDTAPTAVTMITDVPSVNENDTTLHLEGQFVDPDLGDPHTATINWGDGTSTVVQIDSLYFTFSANHIYSDDNPTGTPSDNYTISVVLGDSYGKSGLGSKTVTVNNANPTITGGSWTTSMVAMGAPVFITANFYDIGIRDTHTCQFTWGDSSTSWGTVTETTANPPASQMNGSCTAQHSYSAGGAFVAYVTLYDDDGGSMQSGNITFNVNSPPEITSLSATTINENGTTSLTGSFTDANISTHTVTINWGDGTANTTLNLNNVASGFTTSHKYLDDGPYPGNGTPSDVYTITVTVKDPSNTTDTDTTTVTVNNVNPNVSSVVGANQTVTVGTPATIKVNFTDVGTKDVHTCSFAWSDAVTNPGTVTETNGSGNCTDTRTFTTPGVYTWSVTVMDDDSGSKTATSSTYKVTVNP